jgi:hypothetical protein
MTLRFAQVLSQFTSAGKTKTKELSVVTPELKKSRRTHSLQLAIQEIMGKRASVQSAATKFQIPRETLRRHYQRYLKATAVQKDTDVSADDTAADDKVFSSLLDIGRAYGIWNGEETKMEEEEEKPVEEEKLVIDEDSSADDDGDVSEEEEIGQETEK